MNESLYSNPFSYWKDGTQVGIELEIVEGGKPFCVRISKDHWLPINHMVFAKTKEQAIVMVESAILQCIKETEKRYSSKKFQRENRHEIRGTEGYRDLLENGIREVEEIKLNQAFKIGWGENTLI